MKTCSICNISVYDSQEHCPLCFQKFDNSVKTVVSYPKYEEIIKKRTPLKNLPLFLSVSASIICLLINLLTVGHTFWALIVIVSLLYLNSVWFLVHSKKLHYGKKVIINYILLSFTLVVIDFSSSMKFWSTDYVFPFLSLLVTIYLMVLSLRNRTMFVEYFGYILITMLISGVPAVISFIFLISGFPYAPWALFAVAISSIIITFGLYLFADKMLKEELKKKFHR